MNRNTLINALRTTAILAAALVCLACLPSCNTVAGFGKDIQAIAGGGQDIMDDVSGKNTASAESY